MSRNLPELLFLPQRCPYPPNTEDKNSRLRGNDGKAAPLVLTGFKDYRPHIATLVWFAQEILPLIRQGCPQAGLCIVGVPSPREGLDPGQAARTRVMNSCPDGLGGLLES